MLIIIDIDATACRAEVAHNVQAELLCKLVGNKCRNEQLHWRYGMGIQ